MKRYKCDRCRIFTDDINVIVTKKSNPMRLCPDCLKSYRELTKFQENQEDHFLMPETTLSKAEIGALDYHIMDIIKFAEENFNRKAYVIFLALISARIGKMLEEATDRAHQINVDNIRSMAEDMTEAFCGPNGQLLGLK